MFDEIGRQTRAIGAFMSLYDEVDEPTQALSVVLDTFDKKLIIRQDSENVLKSRMRFQPAMWYRIFIVLHDKVLRLYVNGILDSQALYDKSYPMKRLLISLENNIPPFNLDALKLY